MLPRKRMEEIAEIVDCWERANEGEYPTGYQLDGFTVSTGYENTPKTKQLVDRAVQEMGITLAELREFLEQTDRLIDEELIITSDMTEEELRETESLNREDWEKYEKK